jgi:protein tyrosine phosphatase (PTP) superfamily phosphohydrolase (DUF442 family)
MRGVALAAALACSITGIAAQSVAKASIPGIVNFSHVETTVACAGATTPAALAEVKKMGYASVINLRLASEPGANVDAEAAAAKEAGLHFAPDPMLVDNFIKAVTAPANQPAFIHCASANRAATLWMIKRVEVDKWDVDRASEEAAGLGLTKPSLKTFALDQIQARKK